MIEGCQGCPCYVGLQFETMLPSQRKESRCTDIKEGWASQKPIGSQKAYPKPKCLKLGLVRKRLERKLTMGGGITVPGSGSDRESEPEMFAMQTKIQSVDLFFSSLNGIYELISSSVLIQLEALHLHRCYQVQGCQFEHLLYLRLNKRLFMNSDFQDTDEVNIRQGITNTGRVCD